MNDAPWPPALSLDQEKILHLLTGDRFYSNPSAALREAILNAIDAVHRRTRADHNVEPKIIVRFDSDALTFEVSDNGVGMSERDVLSLFVKIGASAAARESNKDSVGEFGIGVISYFMAGDSFLLQTYDGITRPIGLTFDRRVLAGATSNEVSPTRRHLGTTITINIRDLPTFKLLLASYPYWCRDVAGLSATLLPDQTNLSQQGASRVAGLTNVNLPDWIERAHLGPVSDPTGWDEMTGNSTVSVLYRGVFVQDYQADGLWGIAGSIDVDPKHFKPRLNREAFVEGQFQSEITDFLRSCHPTILQALVRRLDSAVKRGALDKWTVRRWANLWLSLPREPDYSQTIEVWDSVFRSLPAFELAVGNHWQPVSLDKVKQQGERIFVAPFAEERTNDVVQAALRLLRHTGQPVIRGIRRDKSWMRYAPRSFSTTADLISTVFARELPPLTLISTRAEHILSGVTPIGRLFSGPPPVELVRLGPDSVPVLRLQGGLVINLDHESGREIVNDVLADNRGAVSLVESAARHAYEQLTQVAAVVREITTAEVLGPIRRRFIRNFLP